MRQPSCACRHPDAEECLCLRYPEARHQPDDYKDAGYGGCECWCHDRDEDDRDAWDDDSWQAPPDVQSGE